MANNRVDLWLGRISHITQLGLFILALAGTFYTVIPLYQKAAVDEQLAQREIELQALNAQYLSMYVVTRSAILEAFAISAKGRCERGTPAYQVSLGGSVNSVDTTMTSSVSDCLTRVVAEHPSLNKLSDHQRLLKRVSDIGNELDAFRLRLLPDYESGESGKVWRARESVLYRNRELLDTLSTFDFGNTRHGA